MNEYFYESEFKGNVVPTKKGYNNKGYNPTVAMKQ
jgi:hypothetical protein